MFWWGFVAGIAFVLVTHALTGWLAGRRLPSTAPLDFYTVPSADAAIALGYEEAYSEAVDIEAGVEEALYMAQWADQAGPGYIALPDTGSHMGGALGEAHIGPSHIGPSPQAISHGHDEVARALAIERARRKAK